VIRISAICVVYEVVEIDFIVAGSVDEDAVPVVAAGIVAFYCVVVAGSVQADAVTVVADIIACYGIVARLSEVDARPAVADIVAGNCVIVAEIVEADAVIAVVAGIAACNGVVVRDYRDPSIIPQTSRVFCCESYKRNQILS